MKEERAAALPHSYEVFLIELRGFIEAARLHVYLYLYLYLYLERAVNVTLTTLYRHVGRRMHKEVLRVLRDELAEYGARIVATLSQQWVRQFGKEFNVSAGRR